jgi:HEAT repeat protein
VRLTPACLLLVLALLAPPVSAAPPSVEKRQSRRAEVQQVVHQVLEGGMSVPAATSRLRLLREEAHAAGLLAQALPTLVEERRVRDAVAVLAGLETRAAEPTLARLASDRDGPVRMYAAQGLGRLRSRHTQVLLPLLSDKSSGVRREAARALGVSGTAALGRKLVAAARTEPDLETRAVMLEAAGAAGDRKQARALEGFLDDSSESTRFAAARGLCRLGSPQGFAFARKLLASEDRFVRRQGLTLHEGLALKSIRPTLRPLLADKDRGLAAGAARILSQAGDRTMREWLVLASWNAQGEEKLLYEKELEALHLADDERRALLRKAGVAP